MSANDYRIATKEGEFYHVEADTVVTESQWLKFFDYEHETQKLVVIAIIDGSVINNVQLVNPRTGQADKIYLCGV